MPFNRLSYPSPALSLLKAGLAPLGVSTQVLYFTFRLAEMIGVDHYGIISHRVGHGFYHEVSEWIFSGSVFQQTDRDVEGYIENILRPTAVEPLTIFTGLQRAIYMACDSAQSLSRIEKVAADQTGRQHSPEMIEQLLQPILDRHLMIREDKQCLSLAIPVGIYSPRPEFIERIRKDLRNVNAREQQLALMGKVRLTELPRHIKIGKEELDNIVFDSIKQSYD